VKRLGAVDLTNGKVMLSILRFSWPIFVGNAFQQLYNGYCCSGEVRGLLCDGIGGTLLSNHCVSYSTLLRNWDRN
jgi:hypothetical protein